MDPGKQGGTVEPDNPNPRRRGRLAAALLAAAVLAAVPAGVALADGSGGSSGSEAGSGDAVDVQSNPDRGQTDRHDCPEDRERGSEGERGSEEI
jgi:hypothetical protein